MRFLLRCCLLLILPAVVQTQVAQTQSAAPGPITIGNVDSIWSPTLKEYRRYQVYTPPAYRQSVYLPRAYPVMYLLDGDAHFHSVTLRTEPYRLFVGQANTINASDTTPNLHFGSIVQFNSILESSTTSGIRYGYKYYGGDDHGSVPLIAEYDALRFIIADYKADLFKSLEQSAFISEHFARVSAKLGYRVLPPERMVDQFGQIELNRDTTKAVALMRLNAELYPRSSHAFVALGNTLVAKHDTTGARTAYRRSLELAPGNQSARDMLAKLTGGR